jgi:hypothetical protein
VAATGSHASASSYSAEETYERSREQYELLIDPPFKTTSPVAVTGSNSAELNDEYIGFKIKYFTEKLQYPPILLKNANLRKFRLESLKSSTEYKIQVSAFNRNELEGPASNLLVVRTQDAGLFVFLNKFQKGFRQLGDKVHLICIFQTVSNSIEPVCIVIQTV